MKIPQPRTVPDIVKQFYSVISRPVRYASLFYTYYYLVEVENIRELRRDFEKIRDELYVAFYNYGVYNVGRELRFLAHGFAVKGDEHDERHITAEEWQEVGKSREWINSRFDTMLKEARFSRREVAYAMLLFKENCDIMLTSEMKPGITFEKDYKSVEKYCQHLENTFATYSRDITFLSVSEKLFLINNWVENCGGEPWAKICKTLLRRRTTKPTIFVDACWNIQHNTGVWLNKIGLRDDVRKIKLDSLQVLLDNNIDGIMKEVFNKALVFEPSLSKYKEYFK